MNYAVEMLNISKQYPGTLANDDVSIKIKKGSVVCLVGENGAGKSTLMNILYGLQKPTTGEIRINDKPVTFNSSLDALKNNIGMVHQHFMLVEELSVLENVILGMEPTKSLYIDYDKAKKEIKKLMRSNGINIPVNELIGNLPVGVQQKVEIIKTLYRGVDILILDEPTAVLTPQETNDLFKNIRELSSQGKTIIFITHKLDEVMEVSDHIIVMRKGKVVGEMNTCDTDKYQLAEYMVGKKLPPVMDRKEIQGSPVIELENVSIKQNNGLYSLKNINLTINEGEVLGIAGISGNGQGELARVIAGMTKPTKGKILLENKDITNKNRKERLLQGISYIPADRKKEGLCMQWSIAQNSIAGYHVMPKFLKKILGFKFLDENKINDKAKEMINQFDIRTPSHNTNVNDLSGGNQQKVVIARETKVNNPKLLIAAEPTRGVDIGAISFIHNYIIELRNSKTAALIISSDLDEIFTLSDTIAVLYEGEIVCKLKANEVTREELGLYMAGSKRQEDIDE
ncbi:heme ABC transporter ATP-binding protein [Vallitalea longa]|uniref:Heme ABC transporter ATP-binding protein n=1 Tax=Vallitalea longa TaxID=2936439 RepID=A0A9W5YET7_9FIRM|nr:ABC transporter ATP-binding protein [Vallitalea longa]GKX30639.1 heme ABC transporter ATP-binding protein [Vallitalea longa]